VRSRTALDQLSDATGSCLPGFSCVAVQLCVAALAVFSCRWFKAHLLLVSGDQQCQSMRAAAAKPQLPQAAPTGYGCC
jgi:hypothetical protein